MHKTISELHSQHGNFARLLAVLRDELDTLSRDGSPDYGVMRDVMLYMTTFPDRFHHPKEDLVFESALTVEPSLESTVRTLSLEHEQILGKGRRLLQHLEFVVSGHVIPRDAIETLGWEYVAAMYRHMKTEEMGMFRVADQILKPAHWVMIEQAAGSAQDPVFGPAVGADFARLYEIVMQRSDWKIAS